MNGIVASATAAAGRVPTAYKANAAVEGVKQINETAGNALALVFELAGMESADAADNPFFVANGHDDPSPNTAKYFTAQKALRVGSAIGRNMLDVGGIASGAQTASTSLAWYRINALFARLVPPSRQAKAATYSGWFGRGEMTAKAVSKGSLEIQLTRIIRQKMYGAAGGAARTALAFGTAGLSSWFIGSSADAAQDRLNAVFGQDTVALAQGLHWFAFLEHTVGRGTASGPAIRIIDVVWKEFCLAKSASGVGVRQIISEPRGWMVIADMIN